MSNFRPFTGTSRTIQENRHNTSGASTSGTGGIIDI